MAAFILQVCNVFFNIFTLLTWHQVASFFTSVSSLTVPCLSQRQNSTRKFALCSTMYWNSRNKRCTLPCFIRN